MIRKFSLVSNKLESLVAPFKGSNNSHFKVLSASSNHLEINFLEQLKISQKNLLYYSFLLALKTHCSKRIYADLNVLFMIFSEILEEFPDFQQEIQTDFIEFLVFRVKNSKFELEKIGIINLVKKLREVSVVSVELEREAKIQLQKLIDEKIIDDYFIYDENMKTSVGFSVFQTLFTVFLPGFHAFKQAGKIIDEYSNHILKNFARSFDKNQLFRNSLIFLSSVPRNVVFPIGTQRNIQLLSQLLHEESLKAFKPKKPLRMSLYSPSATKKTRVVHCIEDLLESITLVEPFDLSFSDIILSHSGVLLKKGREHYSDLFFKEFVDPKPNKLQSIFNEIKCYEEASRRRQQESAFIECFGCFQHENSLVLVLEFAGDTLENYIKGTLDWPRTKKFSIQENMQKLASALKTLKSSGIFHCDIKPQNILLDRKSSEFKIIDFGVSVILKPGQDYHDSVFKVRGTVSYCSPQVFQCLRPELNSKGKEVNSDTYPTKLRYDLEKADVFSLGMIFAELATRRSLASMNSPENHESLISSVEKTRDMRMKELIKDMVNIDPFERPTFEEILKRMKNI